MSQTSNQQLEKHTLKLSDITDYLVSQKYAKAQDYQEEALDILEVLDKCLTDVFAVLHYHHAAAQAVTNPTQ